MLCRLQDNMGNLIRRCCCCFISNPKPILISHPDAELPSPDVLTAPLSSGDDAEKPGKDINMASPGLHEDHAHDQGAHDNHDNPHDQLAHDHRTDQEHVQKKSSATKYDQPMNSREAAQRYKGILITDYGVNPPENTHDHPH